MSSLEEAQQRFEQAMAAMEKSLAAVQKRQDAQQAVVSELASLKIRYSALEAEHKTLRKSCEDLQRQGQVIAGRLDGTISVLREALNA